MPRTSVAMLSVVCILPSRGWAALSGILPIVCRISNRLRLLFCALLANREFLRREETKVECIAHNLGAGFQTQLLRKARAIRFNRLRADVDLLRDLAAAEPFGD